MVYGYWEREPQVRRSGQPIRKTAEKNGQADRLGSPRIEPRSGSAWEQTALRVNRYVNLSIPDAKKFEL